MQKQNFGLQSFQIVFQGEDDPMSHWKGRAKLRFNRGWK